MSMIRVIIEERFVPQDDYPHQLRLGGIDAANWHRFLTWVACQIPDSRPQEDWFCFRLPNDVLRFRQHLGDKSARPAPVNTRTGKAPAAPVIAATPPAPVTPVKITSADCKKFLDTLDTPFMDRTERVSCLLRSDTWVRLRKYTDAAGQVCRDFANTGTPVVAVLVETPTGVALKRMRSLGPWESAFRTHFEAWVNGPDYRTAETWTSTVMWMSFRPEDFAFGESVGEITDSSTGHSYFFQPVTAKKGEGWDQHSPIDYLFPRGIKGDEVCESTFVFQKSGQDEADVSTDLIFAGFTHDKSLDNISGS